MNARVHTESTARGARAGASPDAFTLVAILFFVIGASACLGGRPETDDDVANDPQRRAERITVLEQAIDQDHEALQDLISEPRQADDSKLYDDPEMRAIAGRLTAHVDELDRLKAVQNETPVAK
jgi:hypothetical protein